MAVQGWAEPAGRKVYMGNASFGRVKCKRCGFEFPDKASIDETTLPCPRCGATEGRTFHVRVEDSASVRELLATKAKRVGEKKPYVESQGGQQLHRITGRWMNKRRVIDRDADLYGEVVTDAETGVIVHECREPLSEHRGHGPRETASKVSETDQLGH
ncbi:MAG: hypothetical protein QOI89_3591 [Solirubrobacteraceae bacterium]|nr:hypothetical protein [Solirubrobacteraceae bacterium]